MLSDDEQHSVVGAIAMIRWLAAAQYDQSYSYKRIVCYSIVGS
jgi:hypothetical protein